MKRLLAGFVLLSILLFANVSFARPKDPTMVEATPTTASRLVPDGYHVLIFNIPLEGARTSYDYTIDQSSLRARIAKDGVVINDYALSSLLTIVEGTPASGVFALVLREGSYSYALSATAQRSGSSTPIAVVRSSSVYLDSNTALDIKWSFDANEEILQDVIDAANKVSEMDDDVTIDVDDTTTTTLRRIEIPTGIRRFR